MYSLPAPGVSPGAVVHTGSTGSVSAAQGVPPTCGSLGLCQQEKGFHWCRVHTHPMALYSTSAVEQGKAPTIGVSTVTTLTTRLNLYFLGTCE
ncbi:hypothetical protein GCM10010307_65360 [Streptomyces vastus]|uniref:Uncharacterized protein n=1 Tax=Streptomyces vastus TaxID=285451 RepID=A0ABP6DY10_9ACTN